MAKVRPLSHKAGDRRVVETNEIVKKLRIRQGVNGIGKEHLEIFLLRYQT